MPMIYYYWIDIVLEEEGDMRSMMASLKRYLNRKGLVLNVAKSKVMRFRKGGERERKKN